MLARVEKGEVVEITNRGRPIARIVPVSDNPLAELIATGAVIPPTVTAPFSVPAVAAKDNSEAGDMISRLRDEERW